MLITQKEIRASAEHLETVIAEAQKRLDQIRAACQHPEMQRIPNPGMGMAISWNIYYCPDCLAQEDRD